MLSRSSFVALLVIASCASVQRGPSGGEEPRSRRAPEDTSAELSAGVVHFSTAMSEVLNDPEREPPSSNSYSHQRKLGPRKRLGEPEVVLQPTDAHSTLSSTDCSGWLSFVLNTVSPLHEAVLQSQRRRDEHNRVYSEDFALRESRRPWPRAFVVTQYLRSDYAEHTGFEPIASFEDLRAGDIGAYAMGRYAKPSDESRPKPRDTGHVFVVTGAPTVVDPETEGYDGGGTLHPETAKVIAIPVIDSSATVHFDPDSRKNGDGLYTLPEVRPHSRARAGGVGTGMIWFSVTSEGRVLQRRLGPQQGYRPVLARAARLNGHIALDEVVLDGSDSLLVRVFDSSPSEFDGLRYGGTPVHLSGAGGLRLAGGRLVLSGASDFTGGVTVESAELIVASREALGSGDVSVRGGSVTLEEPAIDRSATLTVTEDLPEGALRLAFKGRDDIHTLRIGKDTHRCGTWGGPDSRAMFVDPVFSGPGMLEVTARSMEACTAADGSEPGRSRGRLRRNPR